MCKGYMALASRKVAMSRDPTFEEINDVKAGMGHIYDKSDPRAYFRELTRSIHQHAAVTAHMS